MLAAEGTADAELEEMREIVQELRGQMEAQAEQLAHQGEVIRKARLDERREAKSGLSGFFEKIEVEGWVAASYFYNFNDPGNTPAAAAAPPGIPGFVGGNTGAAGNIDPFHTDHNTFNLDQVWFGIEKLVTEESPAGFRFDIVYGKTACTLGASPGERCLTGNGGAGGFVPAAAGGPLTFNDATSQFYVNQAYVPST